MSKIKIAVVGASGYSGEELLRLLLRHDSCEISVITSRQNAGAKVGDFFPRFTGSKLVFSAPDTEEIAGKSDVVFLALPHGLAAEFAVPLLKKGLKVIDLSADFRLKDTVVYKKYYKEDHPAPALLKDAVYGLPERYRSEIKKAKLIACPGCYPTSIILPLSPLLENKLISPENIVVNSLSGVSGAGRKVDLAYIFPECNESMRAYAVTGHRHLPEIEQELGAAASCDIKINFVPHLIPVNRGINSTIVTNVTKDFSKEKLEAAYKKAYSNEKFVRVLGYGKQPDTKYVTMSNYCDIGFTFDEHTGKLIVNSCIDNLTKGASGQAIQCMNIIFGLDESAGLL
ncbi:MAG TPA: N-acetyl-gamma-glutamyl-phosphate reductase [Lentisphaeria bacterium]|nr:MAG: N-acetyl-gamma-glutamyl-phosphate reductase [Lentisphaerae bacterium GWF2_50_93]HCE43951.1 N-acetyl-gamma-glutamyl-phosphate reductase [Lentisphaeria bacterium]